MKKISDCLTILRFGLSLSFQDSFDLAQQLVNAPFEIQVEIIQLLQQKGECCDEVLGFVKAFQMMHSLPNGIRLENCVDVCGTGGDGLNTFNASTAASFIAFGAQVPIIKSGNRAMSGTCGSSDVVTALNIQMATTTSQAYSLSKKVGLVFIATASFFPEFAKLTQARKQVGGLTIGNLVGPLLNPLGVRKRVLGVPTIAKAEVMAQVLQKLQLFGSLVVTGENGEDEITSCGKTHIFKITKGGIERSLISPLEYGMSITPLDKVKGGASYVENAEIIRHIMIGVPGPKTNMALLNAAAIISIAHGITFSKALAKAQYAISSGVAQRAFEEIQSL